MANSNFDGLANRLLSGGLSALVIKTATAGLSYIMLVVLARVMTPDEYGRFGFGFSLAITVSLFLSFGLPVAVLRFWPEYKVKGSIALARSFVARGFATVFIGSSLAAAVVVIAASAIPLSMGGYDTGYLSAIATLMTLMAVSEFVASALRANGSIIIALGARDVLWRMVLIGASLGYAVALPRFGAVDALHLASVCLFVILLPQMIYAARHLGISSADFVGETQVLHWWRVSWPMWGSATMFGVIQQFDTVMLGLFLSPAETGPYFAALRTASLMTLLLIAGNMVAAPMISHFYYNSDDAGLNRMCSLLIIGIAVPTLIAFGVLIVLGKWLLGLFDPSFVSTYSSLVTLGLGFAITSLAGPVSYFLQMVGRERVYLFITAVVYVVVIITQCFAIPVYGAMGAALPNALGAAVTAFCAVWVLRRQVGFDPSIVGLAWPVHNREAAA